MSIEGWPSDPKLGQEPCKTSRESWQCPNMKARKNDLDMSGENYDCAKCGRHVWQDYEEMK